MPGIFGYIIKNGNISVRGRNLLEKMGSCLHHFPFYKCDSLNKDKVGMGNMAVNQKVATPVYGNSDYSILISFHGYIAGFYDKNMNLMPHDNHSVYKPILDLYNVYGDEFPQYLSGLFNIALYDQGKDTFLICNDRMGFLHQYIYEDEDILMFSPELKAFLAYLNFDKTIDEQALSDYFLFWYHLGDRTFFRNVKLLPPATVITVKQGIVSKSNYWSPKYTKELTRRNLQEAAEEGYRIFRSNLSRIIGNHKRILIPISGGLDSRLILSVASETEKEIKTATFGTKRCLEYKLAKRVCKELGLDSPQLANIIPDWFRQYGEKAGFLGEASYGTLGVTSLYGFRDILGTDYDIFLNGIFGGHISFGSPYYTTADLQANYDDNERLKRIIRGFNGHRYDSFLRPCFSKELQEKIKFYKDRTIEEEWDRSGECGDEYVFRQDGIFIYNRIRRGMNALNHNRFWYNEYFPFATYELYDFYLKLSPELTLNHYLYKEIYKRYIPDLAKIPWQNTGLNLYASPSAFTRTRALIRKYVVWYTGRLSRGRFEIRDTSTWSNSDYNYRKSNKTQKWVRDVLLSEKALNRGYFSKKGVSQLLDREARGGSVFEEISKLVLFELWCQNFLEQ